VLCRLLYDEPVEYSVPQFIAECIRLQAFWSISAANQDGTHPILHVRHDDKGTQSDALFNNIGIRIFTPEIGIAADTSKLAAQNV